MGEIADGLIDGEFDFYTGEYLGGGVGYPRTRSRTKTYSAYYCEVLNLCYQSGITGNDRKFKSVDIIKEYGDLLQLDITKTCNKIFENKAERNKFKDFLKTKTKFPLNPTH